MKNSFDWGKLAISWLFIPSYNLQKPSPSSASMHYAKIKTATIIWDGRKVILGDILRLIRTPILCLGTGPIKDGCPRLFPFFTSERWHVWMMCDYASLNYNCLVDDLWGGYTCVIMLLVVYAVGCFNHWMLWAAFSLSSGTSRIVVHCISRLFQDMTRVV